MTRPSPTAGVWHLGLLADAAAVAQLRAAVSGAQWITRNNSSGRSEVPDPASHGAVTSRICDYFSHPDLLGTVGRLSALSPGHFIGTLTTVAAGADFGWSGGPFALALVVNPVMPWQLGAGEGALLDLRTPLRHLLTPADTPRLLVDGVFV